MLEKRRCSRRCKIRPLSPWMRTKYAQIYHPRPQVSVAFSDDRDHARLTGTGASLLAGAWFARVQRGAKDSSNICVDGHGENGPYTHGHWTDSACCRRTPCLHRLRTASVRLRTVSVCIGTASTTEDFRCRGLLRQRPLSKRSQYRLKRYANGLKRYANGASTASVYSRLSPSYARVYGPFLPNGLPRQLIMPNCGTW